MQIRGINYRGVAGFDPPEVVANHISKNDKIELRTVLDNQQLNN